MYQYRLFPLRWKWNMMSTRLRSTKFHSLPTNWRGGEGEGTTSLDCPRSNDHTNESKTKVRSVVVLRALVLQAVSGYSHSGRIGHFGLGLSVCGCLCRCFLCSGDGGGTDILGFLTICDAGGLCVTRGKLEGWPAGRRR